MELPSFLSLGRIVVICTVLTVAGFFSLLIVANMMNRRGIAELQILDSEIDNYSSKIKVLDHDIATYSSLLRVEQRAKEMGLQPAKKIEYVK